MSSDVQQILTDIRDVQDTFLGHPPDVQNFVHQPQIFHRKIDKFPVWKGYFCVPASPVKFCQRLESSFSETK
jgi:hypothetical protein